MRLIDRIQFSREKPKNINILWLDTIQGALKFYGNNGWQQAVSFEETEKEIAELGRRLEELGVTVENNHRSLIEIIKANEDSFRKWKKNVEDAIVVKARE